MRELRERLERVEAETRGADVRAGKIEVQVENTAGQIANLEGRLDNVAERLSAQMTSFEDRLDSRMTSFEGRVDNALERISTQIQELHDGQKGHDAAIASLGAKLTDQQERTDKYLTGWRGTAMTLATNFLTFASLAVALLAASRIADAVIARGP